MKKIDISTKKHPNTYVLVDNVDFVWLNQWKWGSDPHSYAIRNNPEYELGGKRHIRMHRLINNTPEGFETDHIDRNPLNNQRTNLRTVTKTQNNINRSLQLNNKSGYRGIYWDKKNKKWRASIQINSKMINLGRYHNIQGAWLARKLGERIYFKEFDEII